MKKSLLFIANPIAGTQNKMSILAKIKEYIDCSKYNYEIVLTQYAGQAAKLAMQAVQENVYMVIAVGGDGTVNEIAGALRHTKVALGIIPCGSGNGLARHLNIPFEIKDAISVINNGTILDLDYGSINDIPFFCTCGVGFDALVSLKFSTSKKRGITTYIENILRESIMYKPEKYVLETEYGTYVYDAFLITCANASQYGNNGFIAPQASVLDGLIDVTVLKSFTVLDVPTLVHHLLNKTIDHHPCVEILKCREITIHREKSGIVHYDGEPTMTNKDVSVKIFPKGIKVMMTESMLSL